MATKVEHLNAGWLQAPPNPRASCHCLVLRDAAGVALVETGLGLQDIRSAGRRLVSHLVDIAETEDEASHTAVWQLERRGIAAADVRHVILTHLDSDHAGGLADFPAAQVHVAAEELAAMQPGVSRYVARQFAHGPRWVAHGPAAAKWFGFEARPINIGFASQIFLVPLFGHTPGHCGVAIQQGNRWIMHIGDAYYLRVELTDRDHPINKLSTALAMDGVKRLEILDKLLRLDRDHNDQVDLVGYHDVDELPPECRESAHANSASRAGADSSRD